MLNTEELIFKNVYARARAIGFPEGEVDLETDLIRSGLYDSMSFIDLIVSIEEAYGIEIDLEKISPDQLSTPAQLKDAVDRLKHA
jgi:acyl carrier protein